MPPSLPAANTHRQIQFLGRIQIKRRTHLARVYCKEPSLLRLITALLCETSQDWETEKLHQHANTTLSFFLILVHFTDWVLRVLFWISVDLGKRCAEKPVYRIGCQMFANVFVV